MRTRIYLSALLLLLMHLPTLAQIGGDYNPDNPGDPGTPTVRYTLTVKAVPSEGGSSSTTKLEEGQNITLNANPSTSYVFVAWVCEGDTTYKSSFNYVMPNRNVEILCLYRYDPTNPQDPDQSNLRYQLTLVADPANGGSFNISNERITAGSTQSLQAYANTDYVFKQWLIGDSIAYGPNISYTMPDHNVTIVGQFEYNPSSPTNPNANYWNPLTGEVIVDDFTPGKLSTAISSLLSRYNSNNSDVESIIVVGQMKDNDFGIANTYKNCAILDLRRVTGISEVPSLAFDNTKLESVYLPATIEIIGNKAFYQCAKLKTLTVYALTPPAMGANVFTGVPDGLVVYVPEDALDLYKADPAWGQFFLLPITEGNRSITIYFSSETSPIDYANMRLELTNIKNGRRMHYVVSDKNSYKFNNIDRNSSWRVTLTNQYGDEFGHIENIKVGEEDVAVVLPQLKKAYSVKLSVKNPDGQDVTDQARITWLDEKGETLVRGNRITGLPEGRMLTYSVILPQELATLYSLPTNMSFVVSDGLNDVVCQLNEIVKVHLSGKVMDAATCEPFRGATISAIQTFAGGNNKTISTQTDSQGDYALDVASAPTTITVNARNYISQTLNCDSLMNTGNAVSLPDIILQPFTGAIIKVDLTYTKAHLPGEDADMQEWFSDFNNVDYEVFNKSTGRAITNFNVQFPRILLMDEVNDGNVLELTATSRKNEFKPVKTIATIAEQKATVTFDIVEMGKIVSQFNRNLNPTVAGTLYDANGKLVNSYKYSNAALTINNLNDGEYTLVTMGGSLFYNTISDLSDLPQIGLTEGVDYVQNTVNVENGIISAVEIDEVPTLDETKLYYTGENTSFTVNKSNIVIGNYLTLTGHIDFKPQYERMVENVYMIVDIPESCSFVENSVMVENSISAYSVDGNKITIPLVRYTDRVRLCVIPTSGGEYELSALAQFDINGNTITQPVGAANYSARELSFSVPSRVAKTVIPVTGTAIGVCDVNIYDNNILIGHTTSLANGLWSSKCVLNDAFDMSVHNIYAEVTTKTGLKLMTENKSCVYDKSAIKVSSVTMVNTAHPSGSLDLCQYTTVFDFLNPASSLPAYWYWSSYPDFTFLIDFTNNDTTLLSDVVLNVYCSNNEIKTLHTVYDKEKDKYIASEKFGHSSLPINVSVNYSYLNLHMVDSTSVIGFLRNNYSVFDIDEVSDIDQVLSFSIIPKDKNLALHCVYTRNSINQKDEIYNRISRSSFELVSFENQPDEGLKYYSNNAAKVACQVLKETSDSIFVYAIFDYNDTESFINYISSMRGVNGFAIRQSIKPWRADEHENGFDELWIDRFFRSAIDDAKSKLECAVPPLDFYLQYAVYRLRVDVSLQFVVPILGNALGAIFSSPSITIEDFLTNVESLYESIPSSDQEILFDIERSLRIIHDAPSCDNVGGIEEHNPGSNASYVLDPSGFVYEGVPSNRLQGVTATCYYKETVEDMYGDLHENVVLWDAEQYSQENPLLTDENGFYRWDVPIGLWQVKYEKEGYETTYSDWLPVPPPQLDVNIGMVQMRQPEVVKAHAYPQAVELEFDKYMLPETLNEENITVSVDGTAVSGTIELLNAEVDDPNAITSLRRAPGTGLTLASKVRFNADSPFNADKVTLHVNHDVESYAGVQMNDDYEAVLDIEYEMTQIVADSLINVIYGDSHKMIVKVEPALASKGKTLNVRSFSSMIISTDAETYTLDNNGQAVITVYGDLPGSSSLLFDVDGYDLSAATLINVVMVSEMTVATPTASIASGSEVKKGTELYLYCATEGATIYYTLDGSCPCDNTEGRMVYDGSPIIINNSVTIKAMAVAEGMYDSEVATFTYRVKGGLKGDVNGDGTVNIADINKLIDYILRDLINSETLERGDVNGDNTINIADINAVIQIILGPAPGAKAAVNTADVLHMNDLMLQPGETGTLSVTVDNAERYSAMQCDIVLPDGLALVNSSAMGAYVLETGTVGDNTSRAITYSMNLRPFADDSQSVLTLTVRANAALTDMSQVVLTEVVLADVAGKAWYANDCFALVNNTSGVKDLYGYDRQIANIRYYNVAGQEVSYPEGLTIQVTTYTDGTRSATRIVK